MDATSSRRRRVPILVLVALTVGVVVLSAVTASAHPTTSFTACAKGSGYASGCLGNNTVSPYSLSTMVFRGRVQRPHAGRTAVVWRRAPWGSWERVARVPISASGRMRWAWTVVEDDVSYEGPYRVKFSIPGHGRSPAVKLWVIFGE